MNTHIYNKIVTSVLAGLLMLAPCLLSSCDEFLDEMPDNRTTIDKEKKVKDILTSAYPDHEYGVVCEFSSDNVDEFNNTNGSSNRWFIPNRSLGPISLGDIKVFSCSPESKECLSLVHRSYKA